MKFGVVVVTYNRLEKLKRCLSSYEQQSHPPKVVLVVDNHSTDGTAEYLDEWRGKLTYSDIQKIVLHCSENMGGAGGFYVGIEQMLKRDVDWIYIGDDDAYPERECLKKISQYHSLLPLKEKKEIVAMCSKVVYGGGKAARLHRRRLSRRLLTIKEIPLGTEDYELPAVAMDLFSFVGVCFSKKAVITVGLPEKDFFICFDDTEYSLRMSLMGKIMCVPASVIVHDSDESNITKQSWKYFYMFRNKLYVYKKYFSRMQTLIELLKTCYMIFLYYNCKVTWKQFIDAVSAVKKSELGINDKYIPN